MKPVTETGTASGELREWRRPFFMFWGAQALSLLGSAMVQFALVWWLTFTTNSATVLALASAVALVPQIVVGPFAGALVDRWNRRRVMIAADALVALLIAGLAILFVLGRMQVWHVYLVIFLRAVAQSFHWPATQASTSLMVPPEQLARVAGLNQMLGGLMQIVAPPLAALLLQVLPLQTIMLVDITTAALAITLVYLVHIPQPDRAATAARPSVLREMGAGFRYVWNWKGLFALLAVATLLNLVLAPASALMPIFVTREFGGAALELSYLQAGWGIGTVAGGLLLGVWGGFRRRIYTSVLGLIGIGGSFVVAGLAPREAFWLAVGAMFVSGGMGAITNGPIFAILQSIVTPEMQGRVFTVVGSAAMAMMPLGIIFAGPVADTYGVRICYVAGGLGCVLISLACLMSPVILHIEEQKAPAEPVVDLSGAG